MKTKLISDLIGFAGSRVSLALKIKYALLGCVFLPFLVKHLLSSATKESDSSISNQAGDDIYPLF